MPISRLEYLDILNFTQKLEDEKREGHLEFPEPPATDCFYTDKAGLTIGIEHTTLILENHPKLGDVQRAIQQRSNHILRLMREEFKDRGYNSIDLVISFDYQSMRDVKDLNEVCNQVADLLDSFIKSGNHSSSHSPRFPNILFDGVKEIRMNKNEGSKYVRIIHSHWSSESIELEPLLEDGCQRKADKVERYRESCDTIWLLLVNTEPMFSPIVDLDKDYILPPELSNVWDDIFIYSRISGSFRSLKHHT